VFATPDGNFSRGINLSRRNGAGEKGEGMKDSEKLGEPLKKSKGTSLEQPER